MIDNRVLNLCRAVSLAGGRALIVGGWVRDFLLGSAKSDYDIEVYGIEADRLRALLATLGPVNAVGESYTVYKVRLRGGGRSIVVDVSLPRRESKVGRGHRGFLVTGDPKMSFEESARRRDFTINAILYDPLCNETIDPYGGQHDLRQRVLRVVDPTTFVEDSLRVLRAMQFAARLGFTIDPLTIDICRSIDLSDLPSERILAEMEKWLLAARSPSTGLFAARDLGVIARLWPELESLDRGDPAALDRLAASLDRARALLDGLSYPRQLTVMLASLTRDFTAAPAPFLDRLRIQTLHHYHVRAQVLALFRHRGTPVGWHADHLAGQSVSNGQFRRLALSAEPGLLARVERAACPDQPAALDWFAARLRELDVEFEPPAPLLLGRHLLELGLQPGPRIGVISRAVYDLQLDDQLSSLDEAIAAARSLIASATV